MRLKFLSALCLTVYGLTTNAQSKLTTTLLRTGHLKSLEFAKANSDPQLLLNSSQVNLARLREKRTGASRWRQDFGCEQPGFDTEFVGPNFFQRLRENQTLILSLEACTSDTVCDSTNQERNTAQLGSAYYTDAEKCFVEKPPWILEFYKDFSNKDPEDLPSIIPPGEIDNDFILVRREQWNNSGAAEFLAAWTNLARQQPDYPPNGTQAHHWAEYLLQKWTCGIYSMDCAIGVG